MPTIKTKDADQKPTTDFINGYLDTKRALLGGMEAGVTSHESADEAIDMYLTGVRREAGELATDEYESGVATGVKLWMARQDSIPFDAESVLRRLTKTSLMRTLRAELYDQYGSYTLATSNRLRKEELLAIGEHLEYPIEPTQTTADMRETIAVRLDVHYDPNRNYRCAIRKEEALNLTLDLLGVDDDA